MLQTSCEKFEAVASDAAAIRYGHSTATSITNVLRSPVFCKRPKIARKNTKAAAAEATEVATKAKASVRMEEIKSLPAEYETMDCGTGTEALVQAATYCAIDGPRTPCSASQMAARLLARKFRRPARRPPLRRRRSMPRWPPPPLRQRRPLLRKPAAHEATAAAAANKQHALDACAPSEKSDLPREPGDGVEIMDDEGFSGGRGAQHDDAAQRRRGCCRASPRAAARPY